MNKRITKVCDFGVWLLVFGPPFAIYAVYSFFAWLLGLWIKGRTLYERTN
jgi:hypothetical protein